MLLIHEESQTPSVCEEKQHLCSKGGKDGRLPAGPALHHSPTSSKSSGHLVHKGPRQLGDLTTSIPRGRRLPEKRPSLEQLLSLAGFPCVADETIRANFEPKTRGSSILPPSDLLCPEDQC